MAKWPRSGWVQIIISSSAAVFAVVFAFPITERYLAWYYSRDVSAVHDGQTGLSVFAGGLEAALAAFVAVFMLTLLLQQIKTGQFFHQD